jgi:CheY-like chemotaxis protein
MSTLKCFLIDDEEYDREIFHYALRSVSEQIDFEFAVGGPAALAQLKQTDSLPDYIFVDMYMPGMNGLECLEAIKKVPSLQHIPVIIYSGIGNREHEQRAKELHATHYIIKPFTTEELTHILIDLLSGRPLPFLLPASIEAK